MSRTGAFDAFVIRADRETAGTVVRLERGFRFFAATNDFVALEGRFCRRPRDAQRAARDRLHALLPVRRPRTHRDMPQELTTCV
jgi:hypothetical protein